MVGVKALPKIQFKSTWVRSTFPLIATFVLSACGANTLSMDYICNPAGASLYEDGNKYLGSCPATITYQITKDDRSRGYVFIRGMSAKWASGASHSFSAQRVPLSVGTHQSLMFNRPSDAPGLDADLSVLRSLQQRQQQYQMNDGECQMYSQSIPSSSSSSNCPRCVWLDLGADAMRRDTAYNNCMRAKGW